MSLRRGLIKRETAAFERAAAKKSSALDGLGARLTRIRDIALVGFAGIYAFGYLARAIHAWEHNLGVLPGVEFQYFIAGLALLIPVALLLGTLWCCWRGVKRYGQWEQAVDGRRQRADQWLYGLIIGGVLLLAASNADSLARAVSALTVNWVKSTGATVTVAAFVTMMALAFARPESDPRPRPQESTGSRAARVTGRVSEFFGKVIGALMLGYFGLLGALLLLVVALFGVAKLLPSLPQALGGAAPRCAQFDLDPAALSQPMAELLFPADTIRDKPAGTRVVRSRELMVYFSGSESILFKLAPVTAQPGVTHELKRSAINATVWCR